ncbi:MAG: hypothetical protein ACRDJM_04585 [Actinomycetota bacterium]
MRRCSLLAVLCVLASLVPSAGLTAYATDGPLHPPVFDPKTGLLDYGTLPDGRRILTHGPDPLSEALVPGADGRSGGEVVSPATARPYPGYGRTSALQCHPAGDAALYETIYYAPTGYPQNREPQDFAANVVAISSRMAAESFTENDTLGRPAYVTPRFLTDADCAPVVEVIRGTQVGTTYSAIVNDLANNFGKNRTDRKYLIYAEGYTSYCGQGSVNSDQTKSPNNANNIGPDWSVINLGCVNGHTALHEIGHNLGSVLLGSPNANGFYHCIDENDRMCYAEQGIPTINVCLGREWWDCNHNDYFHPNPPAGTYLATRWNMASDSSWLDRVDVVPPWIDDLVVTDESDYPGQQLRVRLAGRLLDNWGTKNLFIGATASLPPIPNGCPQSGYGAPVQGIQVIEENPQFQGDDFDELMALLATDKACYELQLHMDDLADHHSVVTVHVALGIDIVPPVATIGTTDGSILVGAPPPVPATGSPFTVTGEARDAGSGVEAVVAQFTVTAGPLEGQVFVSDAELSCAEPNNRICSWSARAPETPGTYMLNAYSEDRAGNFSISERSINVIVI